MKNTFLHKVYYYNRKLFWGILFFFILSISANLTGLEQTPFFVWSMYSKIEQPQKEYEVLKITVNENAVIDYSSDYLDNTRFFLSVPLAYYKEIKGNNNIDPTISFLKSRLKEKYNYIAPLEDDLFNTPADQKNFLPWYQRYLQQTTGIDVKSIKIEVLKAHYNEEQRIVIDSINLMEKWPCNY